MRHGLCNDTGSVRLSVCLSVRLFRLSPTAVACGGFAAVGPDGSTHRSTAAASTAANAGSVALSADEGS